MNTARLLELGEELNLTECVGYFLVQSDNIFAPEHPAVADLLEIGEHLCEDGFSVMLEFVVQTAERLLNFTCRNWLQIARLTVFKVPLADPVFLSAGCFPL